MNDLCDSCEKKTVEILVRDQVMSVTNELDQFKTDALDCTDNINKLREDIKNNDKTQSNLKIYSDKILGKGSYSKVFPGRYKDNMVAVKIISTIHLDDKVANQLSRELDIVRVLQKNPHPNIVQYYKIFNASDKMIIVMELCSGGELLKHIKKGLDYDSVRDYFTQILKGYKHLLSHNIVHRDIKSANLLLSNDRKTIKFIDFGLSKIFSIDLNSTICGSPLYMAPELLNQQDYDSKSDIWSLGVLLYEMVYGITPFHECKTMKSLKQAVPSNKIKYSYYSTQKLYRVPDNLIKYMKRLLELDPDKRIDWNDMNNADWLTLSNDSDSYNDSCGYSHSAPHSAPHSASKDAYEFFRFSNEYDEIDQDSKSLSPVKSREILNPKNNTCDKEYLMEDLNNNEIDIYNYDPFINSSKKTSLDVLPELFVDISSDTPSNVHSNKINNSLPRIIQKPNINSHRSKPIQIITSSKRTGESRSYRDHTRDHTRDNIRDHARARKCDVNYSMSVNKISTYGIHGESLGDTHEIHFSDINVNDLSCIDNNPGEEYDNIIKKQKLKASESGLIDIGDLDDMLIANVPEKTTAFEYISKGSVIVGSYFYSRSAPIASSFVHGIGSIGDIAKTTAEVVGIIKPVK